MKRFAARIGKGVSPGLRHWAAGLVAAAISLGSPAAQACFGTRVTHLGDDRNDANGTCTLREAIRAANGNVAVDACPAGSAQGRDRICLPGGTYSIDLSLGGQPESASVGDLDVTGALEIVGVAADATRVVGSNGSAEFLLSIANTAGEVLIRDLTLEQSSATGGVLLNTLPASGMQTYAVLLVDSVVRGARGGSGVVNLLGSMKISGSRIEANHAPGNGGGISNDLGTLRLDQSAVVGNESDADGGGIASTTGSALFIGRSRIADNRALNGRGGGLFIGSDFDVQYSEFSGNRASAGGGVFLASGTGEIQRSAFVANTATTTGGGIHAAESTAIRFSTLTQNSAAQGGAVFGNAGQVLLDADTIAGNSAGGGVHNQTGVFCENVLLADNAGGNCTGTQPNFGAYNLEDANHCGFVNNPAGNQPNLPSTEPLLGALADNGGPTPTMALLPGSPAIDVVSSEIRVNCQNMFDQRGYPRGRPRQNVGGTDVFRCDIGAFEKYDAFLVDTGADAVDASPDDDRCATAGGTCSLRAAIQQANATPGFDEIALGSRRHTLSIAGRNESQAATGDLDLNDNVLIRGVGAASIVDGAGLDRIFDVLIPKQGSPNFYLLRDLRITGGATAAGESGGGIRGTEPGIRLERVRLDGNAVGAFDNGAAVWVRDFAVFAHRTRRALTLVDSTVTNNSGNMPVYASDALIQRSTIHANLQDQRGSEFVAVRLENSTVSGNVGDSWSAFFANQAFIDASTIFANRTSSAPGAVFLLELSAFRNSIIANNLVNGAVSSNCSMNQFGIQSLGHNLTDTQASDCNLNLTSDQTLTAAGLDALADNGGPTPTHMPQAGSRALDQGDPTTCPPLDQRGFARPVDGNADGSSICDIGAVERGAGADRDGDGRPDSSDNCPYFANPTQADTDGDGRGDLCECTDQTGDGRNDVTDLVAINVAIFNPGSATPLCDGNNDGLCNVSDIVAANVEIFSPGNTSICARQPVTGP